MSNKNYLDFINQLDPSDHGNLQAYAKNRVMEPFEGQEGMETLQETNLKLTSGIARLKALRKSKKPKEAVNEPEIEQIKPAISSSILKKLGKLTSDVGSLTKYKLKEIEIIVKDLIFDFLKKGLELSESQDYEKWILKNATHLLNRKIETLEQIRELSDEERKGLVSTLYPYRSRQYRTLLGSFDKTVSVFLGAVVATNLPGTGIVVSLVNMAKTIIRMSNRINSLSVIYGYNVENLSGLFEVCALLLKSIEDWDKNINHKPLHPSIMEKLYNIADKDHVDELSGLIEAVGNKEMYIAIPGIGMLSLGKINLDNLKIDLLIENIIQDYFFQKQVEDSENKEYLSKMIEDYQIIFEELRNSNYYKTIRKKRHLGNKRSTRAKIGNFFKTMVGSEVEFDTLSADLTTDARIIFNTTLNTSDYQKRAEIKLLVERLLNK